MKLSFQYGTKDIECEVKYRNRKTIEVSVEPPDKVTVVAPEGTTNEVILNKVKSKASWIVQRLFEFEHMEFQPIKREYVNGESFMYLGRNYSMQIFIEEKKKKPEIKLHQGKFYVFSNTKDEAKIQKAMEQWYREKALEKVKERVDYYQHYFKKKPTEIKVKEQQKRWASCTSKNELLFNWRCVMAPSNVLDYIVVHEMCHMYHKNHSQEFWDLLSSIMPDYERRREWLRNYGVRMDL